jgi:hypothetical protein
MADANLIVTFAASIDGLVAGVAAAKDALSGLSAPAGEINAQYAALGAAISQSLSPQKAQTFGVALQASAASAAAAQAAASEAARQGADRMAADLRAAAMAASQEEVVLTEDAAKQKIALYDSEYRQKELTESQKLQVTLDALQDELQDEADILNQELQLDNLRPQQRQRILDAMLTLEQNYAAQVQRAQLEAAEQTAQQWQNAFNAINGAFDSQVRGLLTGTTTWSNAVKNVLTTLTADLITFFLNWGLKQAEQVAMNIVGINTVTAAQVAGSAQQSAAQASAGATGALANLGNILHSIYASAAQTFAGVTGFMAPILGPAAPAAGAAAEATVLAVAGGLYDTGAWEIPHDMLAGVHAGEMVIPQRGGIADEFRNFMSGGGFSGTGAGGGAPVHIHPTANFNVSAVDSASTAQWFRNNSADIAKAMNEAARHGALLGLRRLAGA